MAPALGVAEAPKEVRVDYTFYNPISLVIKDQGWMEQEFAKDGIKVTWVKTTGGNKAIANLNSGVLDFGSLSGGAALLARANGAAIRIVYILDRPDPSALVTRPDTGITKIEDLRGKKVAATRGTDPHIFLQQALATVGLGPNDIELVPLQHSEGMKALLNKQVDAWAGRDPFLAQIEVEKTCVIIYRNKKFNTLAALNVREEFADENPEIVKRVLAVYEKGREFSQKNPDKVIELLAKEEKLSPEVAKLQITAHTDLSNGRLDTATVTHLENSAKDMKRVGALDVDDLDGLLKATIDPRWTTQ